MPYDRNSDLPESVRNALPVTAQSRFRTVVNSALHRGLSDSAAFASAWSVIRNGWKKDEDGNWVRKAEEPRTLYLSRKLENAAEFIAWAKAQGFPKTQLPGDMHVTIAYSKTPTDWPETRDDQITVRSKAGRTILPLGDKGAVVLRFDAPTLQARWQELVDGGASWDFEDYKPHVTITWDGTGVDLDEVEPYDGPLVFGPEIAKPIDENWMVTHAEKAAMTQKSMFKVDYEHGLVFGWAIVSKIRGKEYFDLQGDHIPEDAMLKAAIGYMTEHRVGKEMHFGDQVADILFAWPMTEDICKAMGLSCDQSGFMIGFKPRSVELLNKFRDGSYTGFSIGGGRVIDEDFDEAA